MSDIDQVHLTTLLGTSDIDQVDLTTLLGTLRFYSRFRGEIPPSICANAADRIEELEAALERGRELVSPYEAPPNDGSDQIFEMTVRVTAYWCHDLKDWILSRAYTYERLPTNARYIGPSALQAKDEK